MPSLWSLAIPILLSVLSTIVETVEDVYLFWESHYERTRDFEKIDDLFDLTIRFGFKFLCSAVFVTCLALWTWYSLPLERISRRDLVAEREQAITYIQQLEGMVAELKASCSALFEQGQSVRKEYGLLATKAIVLENKLAESLRLQAQAQSNLETSEADCFDFQEKLQKSQARLEQSQRQTRCEDSERKALSSQAQQAKKEANRLEASTRSQAKKIDGYRSTIAKLEDEASRKDTELTRLETARDQANKDLQMAVATPRVEELERLLRAKDDALKSMELENTRNQLAEYARLGAHLARKAAELSTLRTQQASWRDLLETKDAEIMRINAQFLQQRESQRTTQKALDDVLEARDNTMDVDRAPVVSDHICDHSRCIEDANLRAGRISDLESSAMGGNLMIERLQAEAKNWGIQVEGLKGQLEDKNAAIAKLQAPAPAPVESAGPGKKCCHGITVACGECVAEQVTLKAKVPNLEQKVADGKSALQIASRNANKAAKAAKDQLQAKDKKLEEEKAGRQAAVELERRVARESNPLGDEVKALKKALAEMKADRNKSRDANDIFRKISVDARETAKMEGEQKEEVEKQRDGLSLAYGQLQMKMVEVVKEEDAMDEAGGNGASRKRQSEEEENPRAATKVRKAE